jgi:excinuclease ABC subunit C
MLKLYKFNLRKEGLQVNLKEKVKALPATPGVYLMKDSLGSIIYVGKSKNLKNRVGSYFQKSNTRSPKVEKLILNLKDFDYISTDTEFEAFLLECKLIKEIKPRYNRLMKNSMSYAYIKIDISEEYTSIDVSNTIDEKKGAIFFGPYTSKNTVEKALQSLKEFYKILCNSHKRHGTACLNYSLGLCIGICLEDPVVPGKYRDIINKIIALLNGSDISVLAEMEEKMHTASSEFDFEAAGKYRDYISTVTYLLNSRKIIEFSQANKHIIMLEEIDELTIKLFLIRRNKILHSETIIIKVISKDELIELIKSKAISYFQIERSLSAQEITRDEIDEAQIIFSYLKNNTAPYTSVPEDLISMKQSSELEEMISRLCSNVPFRGQA